MNVSRPVTFVNAAIGSEAAASLRLRHGRVRGIGLVPEDGDVVADAGGDRILPGLINSHDHLQLNNFPRLNFRGHHTNVSQWIADIGARLGTDQAIAALVGVPREQRLLMGGLKNILSGVTTVAHHDPFYPSLDDAQFPCRVLADYGWSHSLGLDGEQQVRATYRATPARLPWFIHAGEGIDAQAREEFMLLERLGCVGDNTRLIHGVAFTAEERSRLAARGAGLIWCPGSNLHLFDATVDCSDLLARGCVALGSDSRLSGERDLLDELRLVHERFGVTQRELEAMVTTTAARLLGFADRGALAAGSLADCIILPRELPLGIARRADLRCIMRGGLMVCGDPDYAHVLMPAERRVPAVIDGSPKFLDRALAELLRTVPIHEPGVMLAGAQGRAA